MFFLFPMKNDSKLKGWEPYRFIKSLSLYSIVLNANKTITHIINDILLLTS